MGSGSYSCGCGADSGGRGVEVYRCQCLLVVRNSLSVFSSVTAPQDCSVDAHRVSSTRTPTKRSQHM